MSQPREAGVALGIDVGGTFTDVLALDLGRGAILAAFKLPSTPANPAVGAVEGVDRFQARTGRRAGAVFHGTTVGTNALIEKRAGPVALLATRGFRDVLALRRHARPRLYDLAPRVSPPLVPRRLRLEVDERLGPDGTPEVPLTGAEIARVVGLLAEAGVEGVAVSLLHAYANDAHERRLGEAIARALPGAFVTLSSDVCREFREFERTSTTVVNAFIGPRVRGYVDALGDELRRRGIDSLLIVKSNGGLTSAANARRFPVHLIESGPAAGVVATAALGRAEGLGDLIAFDMGGTTAKVGVVLGGAPRLSTEFYADRLVDGVDVGGYPIKSPVIDVIEIGAGGGSIAHLDAAGLVRVGPRSAGADPGPAAYARGGTRPTVTDAHVALGHIAADGFGSEDLTIDPARAREALRGEIAAPLGWSVPRAAWGVLTLANAHMAEMVRLATLRRGLDPRDFALVAFGGAGPLHAGEIAREVGIPTVIVPPYPGLFSAIGTALCDARHDLVQTVMRLTDGLGADDLEAVFHGLEGRARELIAAEEAGDPAGWRLERHADLRFERQLHELTLPLPAGGGVSGLALERAFRDAHAGAYGYDLPDNPVMLVSARLVARRPVWAAGWPSMAGAAVGGGARRGRRVWDAEGRAGEVAVWPRGALAPGSTYEGPMIVEDFGATIRVLAGQRATVRPSGVLVITEA